MVFGRVGLGVNGNGCGRRRMVSGYVLILAMLILGGIIATVGDRIGTKVGKARLSLFNLRPRQTATLVSIATGSVISASTLAILFGLSSQLRMGVFELSRIQSDLTSAEDQLARALAEQEGVREDLEAASTERQRALARLREINQSLDEAVAQQEQTEAQLQRTRDQLTAVSEQARTLQQSTAVLRTERDRLLQQQAVIRDQIAARDQMIADRDRAIAELDQSLDDLDDAIADRDRAISEREQRLSTLQIQQDLLEQQVADLQVQYRGIFLGNIALTRNQEIISGVFQVGDREQAAALMNQFVAEANRRVIQAIAPGSTPQQPVVALDRSDVDRLIDRLGTGDQFVVRLLSAANYITGEPCVVRNEEPCIQVFLDVTPNNLVYQEGERLATVSVERQPISDRDLVERLNLLLVSAQFRARQEGLVDDSLEIADNRTETLLQFLSAVRQEGQALDLQAIAAEDLFNAGPLHIHLVASRNGRILFSTDDFVGPNGRPSSP